jgi:hypothetical protein
MTKLQKIKELKTEYPILTKQINDEVVELDSVEYEATIAAWADVLLAKETEKTEAEAKIQVKSDLLDRLGITEDEAKLLLA